MLSIPDQFLNNKITKGALNLTGLERGAMLPKGYSLDRVIEDVETIHEIGRLRVAVWDQKQPHIRPDLVKDGMWLENLDFQPNAEHWVVRHNSKIIASCRLSFHDAIDDVPLSQIMKPYADKSTSLYSSINRLVIHPDHRCKGISMILDLMRVYSAKHNGSTQLFADAIGEKRAESLKKIGFKNHSRNRGSSFLDIVSGPFFAMSLELRSCELSSEVAAYHKTIVHRH